MIEYHNVLLFQPTINFGSGIAPSTLTYFETNGDLLRLLRIPVTPDDVVLIRQALELLLPRANL